MDNELWSKMVNSAEWEGTTENKGVRYALDWSSVLFKINFNNVSISYVF